MPITNATKPDTTQVTTPAPLDLSDAEALGVAIAALSEKAEALRFGERTTNLMGDDAPPEARRDAWRLTRLRQAIARLQTMKAALG